MVRNMILLVHDNCMWLRTHPRCPVTHKNVSKVLGKALKIFATIVTLKAIVQCPKRSSFFFFRIPFLRMTTWISLGAH